MYSYYEILELTPEASADEIKHAYRRLVIQYHPDRNKEIAGTERFLAIRKAYEVLSDPYQRALYDSVTKKNNQSYTYNSAATPPPGFSYDHITQTGQKSHSQAEIIAQILKRRKQKQKATQIALRKFYLYFGIGIAIFFLLVFSYTRYFVVPAERMDLMGRMLTALPYGLEGSSKVYQLILRRNAFDTIPDQIITLPNLYRLDISANKLTALNFSIAQCRQLKYLNAAENQITEIPKHIQFCSKLFKLELQKNLITEIPPEIVGAKCLEIIDLSYNSITHLPDTLKALKFLKKIILTGNPIAAQEIKRFSTNLKPEIIIEHETLSSKY